MSILEQIIDTYPSAPYNWLALSMNPAVSFQFINSHRSLPWNMPAVSRNPGITEAMVRTNLEFPWSYKDLCFNPNISFEFILEYTIKPTVKVDINWNALSQHPLIHMETIDRYPHLPWSDRYISSNPNITSNYILNEGKGRGWVMSYVSANPGITERDIYKNVLNWSHLNLSSNPNLPAKYLNDNQNYIWNMHSASANSSITLTDIESFHSIPWDYNGLSINPNIIIEYVLANNHKPWNRSLLLVNPSMTLDMIQSNHNYFDVPNAVAQLCSNPNITTKWIKKNIEQIHWQRLSRNHFNAHQYIGESIDL
jgi:hypothetical protein